GAQTLTTPSYDLPSHGFSGWMTDNMTFTATGSSEVLSFMAYGNQQVPPFALLDGVKLVKDLPEPSDWALMLVGVAAVGAVARARRRGASSAVA
ncbi:MAG TPA: PEP-CTERM sorting domain-containing protein, partial [Caulobacteraceae bacterium]